MTTWNGCLFLCPCQASEELEAANSQLESEIAYLTAEREQLEMMLDAHVCNMEKAAGRGPAWILTLLCAPLQCWRHFSALNWVELTWLHCSCLPWERVIQNRRGLRLRFWALNQSSCKAELKITSLSLEFVCPTLNAIHRCRSYPEWRDCLSYHFASTTKFGVVPFLSIHQTLGLNDDL